MSGHSKWAKIKHQKGANDAKRGSLFTKLAKSITLIASEGGGDVDMNFSLRLAIEKAKQANMPLENIERAVKKGTGEIQAEHIDKIIYEGIGPGGSAFIVHCSTDNKNRTVAEIRKIFENSGGSLATSGSAMWQFNEVGVITVYPQKIEKSEKFGKEDEYLPVDEEETELELINLDGVQDIKKYKDEEGVEFELITDKSEFAKIHKEIEKMKYKLGDSELQFVAKDMIKVDKEIEPKIIEIFENLHEHDDVDNVFTNVELE